MTSPSKKESKILGLFYFALLCLSGAYVLFIQLHQFPFPERDAGVFLYAGQKWLAGQPPYLSIWDHKGPLIYMINALGLWIGRGSINGVRFLQLVFLLAGVSVSFATFRYWFKLETAFITTFWWLITLIHLLEGGNGVEAFALPLQFAALLCFSIYQQRNQRKLGLPLILGLLGALSFLLRANMIAIFLAIGIYWIFIRKDWPALITAIAAGVILLSSMAFVLERNQALAAMIDQSIVFNFLYVQSSVTQKINTLLDGLLLVNRTGLAAAAGIGLVTVLWQKEGESPASKSMLIILLLGLPLEMTLSALSGKTFPHYFISWLPIFALSASFLIDPIASLIQDRPYFSRLLLAVLVCGWLSLFQTRELLIPLFANQSSKVLTVQDTVDYLQSETPANSSLLMWGAEVQVNVLSNRHAPTRFAYLYPLIVTDYASTSMINEFMEGLAEPDLIIIDTTINGGGILPIAKNEEGQVTQWITVESDQSRLDPARQYILENFEVVDELGPEKWVVYRSKK